MNKKKFILVVAAYLVITFASAFIWHITLFDDVYRQLGIFTRLDNPIFEFGILAMLIQGSILAYVYPSFHKGKKPIIEGLKFSYIMGLFLLSVSVIANVAKMQVSSLTTWFVIEPTYHLLQFTLVGIAIGLIYGKNAKSA